MTSFNRFLLLFSSLHSNLKRNARLLSTKPSFESRENKDRWRIYARAAPQRGRLSPRWRTLALFTAWVWMQASSRVTCTAHLARDVKPSSPAKFILRVTDTTCSEHLRCLRTRWQMHCKLLLALFAVATLLSSSHGKGNASQTRSCATALPRRLPSWMARDSPRKRTAHRSTLLCTYQIIGFLRLLPHLSILQLFW
jgi:hypothetical protein